MADRPFGVLFLCTGNSCRSIMAECLLNALGQGRFRAFSAGSYPTGAVNPTALDLLRRRGHPTEGLGSKSWDQFAGPDAPAMDLIVTVCDNAAGEVCPVWPGRPASAHWGFPDPATFQGSESETRAFFEQVYGQIEARLKHFVEQSEGVQDPAGLIEVVRDMAAAETP